MAIWSKTDKRGVYRHYELRRNKKGKYISKRISDKKWFNKR